MVDLFARVVLQNATGNVLTAISKNSNCFFIVVVLIFLLVWLFGYAPAVIPGQGGFLICIYPNPSTTQKRERGPTLMSACFFID